MAGHQHLTMGLKSLTRNNLGAFPGKSLNTPFTPSISLKYALNNISNKPPAACLYAHLYTRSPAQFWGGAGSASPTLASPRPAREGPAPTLTSASPCGSRLPPISHRNMAAGLARGSRPSPLPVAAALAAPGVNADSAGPACAWGGAERIDFRTLQAPASSRSP